MSLIIDRIENGTAVCECMQSGRIVKIDTAHLPKSAKEGDVIRKDADTYVVDAATSAERRERLNARMHRLFDKR